MRIGTNHGSLSDRIMSYYGDSPRGMVNSYFLFFILPNKNLVLFFFTFKLSDAIHI